MNGIATQADVLAIERHPVPLPDSTYAMIGAAAAPHTQAPALSFFLRVQDHERPLTWDYATLFARITATANFFHGLGVGRDDVAAFVLPNLPETHLTIWGGQAAGIVFAVNPMLEPAARSNALGQSLAEADTAVVLVDVIIGMGAHRDPAGAVVDVVADTRGARPIVVASVCGTEADPQVRSAQVSKLEAAGVLVAPSNARAAELALAISRRQA